MRMGVKKVRVLVPAYAGSTRKAHGVERSSPGYERDPTAGGYEGSDVGDDFVPRERRQAKRIIEAWAEAPHFMPVGSKWQVVVPPVPLYGESGTHAGAGPARTMYFEIELVAIQ